MSIPNDEVLSIYECTIKDWFDRQLKASDLTPLYKAAMSEDCK